MKKHLLPFALLAFASACALPILNPKIGPGTDWACAPQEHVCNGSPPGCCGDGEDCGGETPGCPAGSCCDAVSGSDPETYGARRKSARPWTPATHR